MSSVKVLYTDTFALNEKIKYSPHKLDEKLEIKQRCLFFPSGLAMIQSSTQQISEIDTCGVLVCFFSLQKKKPTLGKNTYSFVQWSETWRRKKVNNPSPSHKVTLSSS